MEQRPSNIYQSILMTEFTSLYEVAPNRLEVRKSLRNFPWGSYFRASARNSGSFPYKESSRGDAIVNSFPQCGRAPNGASSRSITGSNLLTAGQSGFSVKWMVTES